MSYALIQVTIKEDGLPEFGAAKITPTAGGDVEEALGEHELMALLHHALAEYHRDKQAKLKRPAIMVVRGRG